MLFIISFDIANINLTNINNLTWMKNTHELFNCCLPVFFQNDYFGLNYASVELTFIENKPVVTRYYKEKSGKETGLKIGDIITSINNRSIGESNRNYK